MSDYKPRIADALLKRKLAGKGAVLIQGPKWCGKTTTAEQIAASVIYLDAPDQLREVKIKADINPQELLAGATPRLLDEWQIVPQLWDTIRYEADHRKGFGHFILTGSSVPLQQEEEEVIKHTGTGRFGRLNMRPMSLFDRENQRERSVWPNCSMNLHPYLGTAISICQNLLSLPAVEVGPVPLKWTVRLLSTRHMTIARL